MENALLDAKDIYFSALDYENDPVREADFSRNLNYARIWQNDVPRPMSAAQIKKLYEKLEKETDEKGRPIHFCVHLKEDKSLIGFIRFEWIEWNHGVGLIKLAIGEPEKNQHYLEQVIHLGLNFSFRELNLRRVEYRLAETEKQVINALEQSGFTLEVRAIDKLFRNGRLVDEMMYGILVDEWENLNEESK